MPGTLALLFNIDLTGGHANNYLVQNVSRALIDRLVVKFAGAIVQDTDGYSIYKIFDDLFLSADERDEMFMEGIQSVDLCKIHCGAGDKKTSSVDAENKLETIYKKNTASSLTTRLCLATESCTPRHSTTILPLNYRSPMHLTL